MDFKPIQFGTTKQKIIFATKNKDKLKEIRAILGDSFDIISMEEAGIDIDVVEDGSTYEENALKKAKEINNITNTLVLADDSGMEIDYLNKAPGVYTARFMGKDTPNTLKIKEILNQLKNVPDEKRTVRYVCVIAVAFPNGTAKTVRGTIEGIVGHEPKGENGFDFDPIFYLPEYQKTFAELSTEEKNKISHRGKALRLMRDMLQ